MKSYVINLDRSQDRLGHITSVFQRAGLQFTRISGVDGRLLSQTELDKIVDPVQRWEIRIPPSEIGCFLSHRRCLEQIAQGEEHYGAIFEDDIALAANARRLLAQTDWIPQDADVIKLDTFKTIVQVQDLHKISGSDFKIGRLLTKHLCCGGYIVSKQAAQRILAHMQVISIPVDNLIFDPAYELFEHLTIYQVTPAVCAQMGLESLIEDDRKHERLLVKVRPRLPGRIVREIKRVYRRWSHRLSPIKIWVSLTSARRWIRVPFSANPL